MARFYRAPRPEFVENPIYQPPWELLTSAVAKREQDIYNQADRLELMRNLPFEFMSGDKENVENIHKELNSQIDTLTRNLSENPLDPTNKANLQSLTRDLQERFRTGDIYNIQTTKKNIEETLARMQTEVTSPGRRDRYREAIVDQFWKDREGRGSLDGAFEFEGSFHDQRNLLEEFADSPYTREIGQDDIETAFSYLDEMGGNMYVATGSNTEGGRALAKLQTAVKAFLQQEGLEGYGEHGEKYFNQEWFDEDGELDFNNPNAEPRKILDAIGVMAYRTKKSSVRRVADSFDLVDYTEDAKNRGAQNIQFINSVTKSSDASWLYSTPEGQKVAEEYQRRRTAFAHAGLNRLHPNATGFSPEEIDDYYAMVESLALQGQQTLADPEASEAEKVMARANIAAQDEVLLMNAKFNSDQRTGLAQYMKIYNLNEKELKKVTDIMESGTAHTELFQNPGYLEVKNRDGTVSTALEGGTAARVMGRDLKGLSLSGVSGLEDYVIKEVTPIENTSLFLAGAGVVEDDKGNVIDVVPGGRVLVNIKAERATGTDSSFSTGGEGEDTVEFQGAFYVTDNPFDFKIN